MRKNDGRLVGLLGTLIIHLLAAVIFMSFKIRNLQQEQADIFTVEFQEVEQSPSTEKEEQVVQLPATSVEKILQGDNEMMNIARNLANRSDQNINKQDYIDMVKEELIKNGQLGKDNYIDEQKRQAEENGDEKLAMETEKPETKSADKPKDSQEMAANYKGPTRIYYELEGRNHTYLPIPIYMCEGSGKVALTITVNQKGEVEEARIIPGESTTNDPCLVETAVSTAMISKFNPDVKAPKVQKGTLTYHFVAQ
ncbi:MAG: energy transducer TonB [Chloroflexota bacterium]